jgi:hypothetical protein
VKKITRWHAAFAALALTLVYMAIADLVFSFRHPWATNTEKFLCIKHVLQFEHATRTECGDDQPTGTTP